MDYELARELEEAGFPQGGSGKWRGPPNEVVWLGSGALVYIPTLEELISACGSEFGGVERASDQLWIARRRHADSTFEGASLVDAVALLWLSLRRKRPPVATKP